MPKQIISSLYITLVLILVTNHKSYAANPTLPVDSLTIVSLEYGVNRAVVQDEITKEALLGNKVYADDPNFIVIDKKYTPLSSYNANIRRETYAAFKKMYRAALKDGIELRITSASRNFFTQRVIWENKWRNSRVPAGIARVRDILKYSSVPGISRHHWGTDIDLMSPRLDFWAKEYGIKVYKWLCENAPKFGFFQTYTEDVSSGGFSEEKWHWSFYPISSLYIKAYKETIKNSDLTGFVGSEYLSDFDIISEYVFGVEPPPTYLRKALQY